MLKIRKLFLIFCFCLLIPCMVGAITVGPVVQSIVQPVVSGVLGDNRDYLEINGQALKINGKGIEL